MSTCFINSFLFKYKINGLVISYACDLTRDDMAAIKISKVSKEKNEVTKKEVNPEIVTSIERIIRDNRANFWTDEPLAESAQKSLIKYSLQVSCDSGHSIKCNNEEYGSLPDTFLNFCTDSDVLFTKA